MAIRLLIVDDSAFMRQVLTTVLSEDPEIEVVGSAKDGIDALEKIPNTHPDVITLDLEMPRMNGLECLTKIMTLHPLPVIMVSSYTFEGAEPTLKAFELGAVDFVTKVSTTEPELIINPSELIQKIKVAATVKISKLIPSSKATKAPIQDKSSAFLSTKLTDLDFLAIGTSTGGPRALHQLLPLFPKNFPLGILIAQHMPKDFTKVFAQRLNGMCPLEVSEAKSGDVIRPGKILIAPSGYQTQVIKNKNDLVIEVADEPDLLYKPSIDYLYKSIVDSCKNKVLAVILTGMGNDGAKSLRELRVQGARTIAEAEESCVVFGMPRAAIELGAAEFIESLPNIYPRITKIISESA